MSTDGVSIKLKIEMIIFIIGVYITIIILVDDDCKWLVMIHGLYNNISIREGYDSLQEEEEQSSLNQTTS